MPKHSPTYTFSILIALFFLLLQGCQLPPQQNGGSSPGSSSPAANQNPEEVIENLVEGITELGSEVGELARPNKVQAWVENLIIKAQPGVDMPQIGTMQQGEVATYLHQRTVSKTAFTLRGQRYFEPWILIQTEDGLMGWVHEGGVRYVNSDFVNWLVKQATQPNTRSAQIPTNPVEDRLVVPGRQVGGIKVSTTEEDLIQLYGPQNIGRSQIRKPGGSPEPCTVVFPQTKDEIRITWKDDSRQKVSAVYIMREGGSWFTSQGLRMGLPLGELTKANRSPLEFYGFGWTYSGTVKSWRSGLFKPFEKKFYVMLSPADNIPSQTLKPFQGNKTYNSNAQGVENLGLYVSRWVVYLD